MRWRSAAVLALSEAFTPAIVSANALTKKRRPLLYSECLPMDETADCVLIFAESSWCKPVLVQ